MRGRRISVSLGILVVALALGLGLGGVGCEDLSNRDGGTTTVSAVGTAGVSGDGTSMETGTSSTEVPFATTTAAPSTTPTAQALSSAETRLSNGHIKAMGYIDDVWVDGSGRHLRIDYAEFYTGDEADSEAIKDGVIPAGEHVDDCYYIRNVNPKLRKFDVSSSVLITTSTRWVEGEGMGASCTWADFLSFWGPGPFPESEQWLHTRPWWIERDGDIIVKIDEQYLP